MIGTRAILIADFSCPFSFVTEAGLRRVIDPRVELRCLAYELFPAPVALPAPSEAFQWQAALEALAEAVGVRLAPPRFVPRTRKAHEAARLAAAEGIEGPMRLAIYDAFWRDRRDIGRIDVLVEIGNELGLDADSLRIRLDIDAAAEAISDDVATARRAGIEQTPILVVEARDEVVRRVGALSLDELRSLPLAASPASPADPGT